VKSLQDETVNVKKSAEESSEKAADQSEQLLVAMTMLNNQHSKVGSPSVLLTYVFVCFVMCFALSAELLMDSIIVLVVAVFDVIVVVVAVLIFLWMKLFCCS